MSHHPCLHRDPDHGGVCIHCGAVLTVVDDDRRELIRALELAKQAVRDRNLVAVKIETGASGGTRVLMVEWHVTPDERTLGLPMAPKPEWEAGN